MSEMLSEHFSRAEMECKCGCGTCNVDPRLLEALEELRERIGQPINVNSCCRCPAHNAAEKGKKNSKHISTPDHACEAADIWIYGSSVEGMAHEARQIDAFRNGGIGRYPNDGFIHVDVRLDGPARWAG